MSEPMELTLSEILYYIFFGLLLFTKGIGLYDGQTGFKLFLLLGLLCMAVKLCMSKYRAKELVIILLILGLTGISYLISGDKGMFLYGLLIVGMKDIPIKRVFKVGLAVWIAAFGGLVLISLFRLHDTPYVVHEKLGLGRIFRWGLGYSHPNVLHISYFILAILIVYVVYLISSKITWRTIFLLFLGNCVVFLYSVSYTGFAVVALFLVGIVYVQKRGKLTKTERFLEEGMLLACVGISLVFPLVLSPDNRLFQVLDKLLNDRLYLAHYFLQNQGFSLFGTRLEDIFTAQLTLDNAYVFALTAYGIVLFAMTIGLYGLLLYVYGKEQRNIEIVIILCILFAGLTEPFLFNTSFKNLSFLFAGELLFRNSRKGKVLSWKFDTSWVDRCKSSMRKQLGSYGKYIFLISLLIGLLAGRISLAAGLSTTGYIVPRIFSDTVSEELHYIDESEAEQYQDYTILGNEAKDPAMPMEYISENIVTVESVRSFLGTTIIVFAACMVILLAGSTVVKLIISAK